MLNRTQLILGAISTVALFALPLAAQLQNGANLNSADSVPNSSAIENGQAPQNQLSEFFQAAASGNTLDIRLAQLAAQRDPQLQEITQTIIRDHTQANDLLQQAAQEDHIQVSLDELSAVDQAAFDELSRKHAPAFTRCYLFDMVGDHAKDVLVYAYVAHKVSDSAARDYANQVLPKLQNHLAMLQRMANAMAGLSVSMTSGAAAGPTSAPVPSAPAAPEP